jgi:hypothetical protein
MPIVLLGQTNIRGSMKNKTNSSHYLKYMTIIEEIGLGITESTFLGYTKDQMLREYKKDKHLNTIPLSKWDNLAYSLDLYQRRARKYSLSEKVCAYKHLALYRFLELEPDFIS